MTLKDSQREREREREFSKLANDIDEQIDTAYHITHVYKRARSATQSHNSQCNTATHEL